MRGLATTEIEAVDWKGIYASDASDKSQPCINPFTGDLQDSYSRTITRKPTDKEPVGERLALAARALAAGEDIEYSGPLYKSMRIEEQQAVLEFTHAGKGLSIRGEKKLLGFTISGEDGVIHKADTQIEGEIVVVSPPDVPDPIAVRYGWENVAAGNLFKKEDLPAFLFRTDFE